MGKGTNYMPSILAEGLTPLPDWLIGPTVCWLKTWGVIPYRTVHVGFSPYNVVVMVDDHRTAENMQVLHHVLLDVRQCGDLGIVALEPWRNRGMSHSSDTSLTFTNECSCEVRKQYVKTASTQTVLSALYKKRLDVPCSHALLCKQVSMEI